MVLHKFLLIQKMERQFREWTERRHKQVLDDFDSLLRETKIITYKSQKQIQENEQHLKDILAVLENDKRYLVLNEMPQERERLLEEYLTELDRYFNHPINIVNQNQGFHDMLRKCLQYNICHRLTNRKRVLFNNKYHS